MIGSVSQMKNCQEYYQKKGDSVRSEAIKKFLFAKPEKVAEVVVNTPSSLIKWRE